MSLKELRKRATEGPRSTCPACGKNVPVSELMSGRHAANDCAPFKQAIKDAEIPKFQKELQKEHSQARLVMKRQTWSERHFDLLGESNFMRQYWAPSVITLCILSWTIGYITPQGSGSTYFITFLSGPIMAAVLIILVVKGKTSWLHNPFKRPRPNNG